MERKKERKKKRKKERKKKRKTCIGTVSNTHNTQYTQYTQYTQHAPPHSAAYRQGRLLLFSSYSPLYCLGTYREPHEGGDTDEAHKPPVVNALPAGGTWGENEGRMREEGRKKEGRRKDKKGERKKENTHTRR